MTDRDARDLFVKLPRDGERRPDRIVEVVDIDTGGSWRPAHRPQNPSSDPGEPGGGESSSAGDSHAWSNCTMSAAAVAFAYEDHYAGSSRAPWGGHLRHNQDDQSGGTDLNDAKQAWSRYGGRTLTIKSGTGWDDVERAHSERRAIVIQGEGDCPGSGDFTGGHACCIGPETSSDGKWLWSDPDTSGWQWVTPSSIKTWAQRISSSILFAVSRAGDPDDGSGTPPPPEDDVMQTFYVPVDPMLASVKTDAWLYQNSGLDSNPSNIQIDPGRDMPYVGKTSDAYIVAYVKSDGTRTDDAYWVKLGDVSGTKPDPDAGGDCPDCPPVEDPQPAIDAAVLVRDGEWEDWLLAGAPGSTTD